MEQDYEQLKQEDIEVRNIKLKIEPDAWKKSVTCQKCNKKMEKTVIDMELPDGEITIHLEGYKCSGCGRERLNGEQAEKLDYLMALLDAVQNRTKWKFTRAMNYDGHNWFVRLPNELTKKWKKKVKSDIIPLTKDSYLLHLR